MQKQFLYSSILFLFCISCRSNDMEFADNISGYQEYVSEAASPSDVFEDYMSLMEYFGSSTRSEERSYPEWYGGCYVKGDSLIVLSTNIENIPLSTRSLNSVKVMSCDNSYNELDSIVKDISSKYKRLPINLCKNIRGFGIDDRRNDVLVLLYEDSEETRSDFKRDFSSEECIRFEQSSGIEILNPLTTVSNKLMGKSNEMNVTDTLICGEKIIKKSDGYNLIGASMGFRVRHKNGEKGIVTAGHFMQKGDSLYLDKSQKPIGICGKSYYNTIMDAAFCRISNDEIILTNRIRTLDNKDTLSIELAQPPTGLIVNAIGYVSKNWGKVVHQSYTLTSVIEGTNLKIEYKDVIIMDFPVSLGDSGGPVYALDKETNTRYTVGTIMGNFNKKDNKTLRGYEQSACIKAYMIEYYLDVTRY